MKTLPMIAATALSAGLMTAPAMAHPHPEHPHEEAGETKRYIKSTGQCDPIGEDTYRSIKNGMTVTEVEYLVGCRGTESSTYEMYKGTRVEYRFMKGRKSHFYIWTTNGFLDQKGGRR